MEEEALVFVEIKSTLALVQRLRENVGSLSDQVEHEGGRAEIGQPPPGGFRAIDPLTIALLVALAKGAAGAVAGKVAVELYAWLRQQIQALAENDRPSMIKLTVGSTSLEVPLLSSPDEIAKVVSRVEQAIKTAVISAPPPQKT
jgi:hypothetical protein